LTRPDKGLRLFGVEDGSFRAFYETEFSHAIFCGVETEDDVIRKVRLTKIQVDGFDATERLIGILEGVEVDAIILGGITFAGFNIVDPKIIFQSGGMPLIVFSGKKPDNEKMLRALKNHVPDWRDRWQIIEGLGPVHSIRPRSGDSPIYFEAIGGSCEWAENILRRSAIIGRTPEPVRVAGLIARGLSPVS
jgi:hypothetical protein